MEGVDDDEYLDMRFEPSEASAEAIAGVLGVETPERYTVSGLGRIFPSTIDSEEFTPLDTALARGLIEIIRDIES